MRPGSHAELYDEGGAVSNYDVAPVIFDMRSDGDDVSTSASDLASACGAPRTPTASTSSAPGGRDVGIAADWYAAYMVAEQSGKKPPL